MSEGTPEVARVASFLRERITGEAQAEQELRGQERLARALERHPARLWQLSFATAAAVAVAAGAFFWSQQVSYDVAKNSGGTSATAFQFSDGSRLELAPGSTGHVENTGFRGARFALERGSLEVAVVHRPLTHWSVQAGPFSVQVTGTRFNVAWSPSARKLVVELREGSVEVRGAALQSPRAVKRGERLIVDLAGSQVLLEALAQGNREPEAVSALAPLPPVTSAAPPEPALTPNAAVTPESVAPHLVGSAETAKGEATPPPSWAERVGKGDFKSVVDDATAQGVDTALRQRSSADLSALADAARYLGDRSLATRALSAQRERFSGSERAAMAAYLLGRLAEDQGARQSSLAWYDRYLAEQPAGTFAQEALGRKMLALQGDRAQAAAVARDYLRRFPNGPRAATARQLADQR